MAIKNNLTQNLLIIDTALKIQNSMAYKTKYITIVYGNKKEIRTIFLKRLSVTV